MMQKKIAAGRAVLLENRDLSSPFVICNCWLTDLQPEMVECKQQNCYI